ncbi:ion transporter [Leuconostoc palmae]|uniref:ion transporter n=1 Tax=Leuconostoc palmae TaxID=501487 RepID=UPI001FE6A6B3|nr:ion transporter [Leuconostoc palmae]
MKKIYYVTIMILSFISITLALLDISNIINLNKTPYFYIDKGILVFFWIDYLTRLIQSKNKKKFFVTNLFDLLAIIPFDAMFYLFRTFRVIRLLKLLRLIRVVGFTGKVQKIIKRFFNTNGFIYLVIATVVLILTGAEIYSVAENSHYLDSLW